MISYEVAKKLKELGFQQKKNRYSKYYLGEGQYIIFFETAHSIFDTNRKTNDIYEEIDWTKDLVYIPTLEDFIGKDTYELTLDSAVGNWLLNNEQNVAENKAPDSQPPAPEVNTAG